MSEDNKESASSFRQNILSSLDTAHHFIDTHPKVIQNTVYGLGLAGIVIVLRSVHVAKFIKHGKDIPKRFIKNGVHLQGRVKEINIDGVIYVQHIPILDLRLPWLRTERLEYLPMSLAFVELNLKSKEWLNQSLVNKPVWFQALKVEDDHPIQAALFQQRFIFWKSCINEKIIEQGICKVINVPDEDMKTLTKKQQELLDRMINLERIADKKGRGIWKEEKPPMKDVVKQSMKKTLYLPVIMVKLLYEKIKNRYVKI